MKRLRPHADERTRLRWGVTGNGVLIIACSSRKRAEQFVMIGRRDTPKDSPAWPLELVDLDAEAPSRST